MAISQETTQERHAQQPAGDAGDGALEELPLTLPERDVRRKRPPALSFILRLDTLRRAGRVLTLLVLDYVGIFSAILLALSLKAAILTPGTPISAQLDGTQEIAPFAYLLTVLLFGRSGLYGERSTRPGLTKIVSALFQVTVVALIYALASREQFSSYYIFYGALAFSVVTVSVLRWGYERTTGTMLRMAGYRCRAVVVGSGAHIEAVGNALADGAHRPVNLVGFISLTPRPDNGLVSLGRLADLRAIIAAHRIQEVIIADPDFPPDRAVELVDICHGEGVRVRIAPSTMELLIQRAEFVPGEALPLFELKPPVFEGLDYLLKRTFDLVVASVLLLVLSPFLAATAVAVRATSRGPAIYRCSRPGIGGATFDCFKFRTMHRDADQRQADLESLNEASGALFKLRRDPRLTGVGRLLRRFSLDELPQLINVLRGEMSLVGPRPLPLRDFERLENWHKKRYLVMPGMTGLWQVSGRSELDFDDLVRLDFLYLERWSVFLDLVILLKTVPAVLSRRGAY